MSREELTVYVKASSVNQSLDVFECVTYDVEPPRYEVIDDILSHGPAVVDAVVERIQGEVRPAMQLHYLLILQSAGDMGYLVGRIDEIRRLRRVIERMPEGAVKIGASKTLGAIEKGVRPKVEEGR